MRLPVLLLLVLWLALFSGLAHLNEAAAVSETPPSIFGWGGSRLIENTNYNGNMTQSIVFPGENASDQELLARTLVEKGLDAMRVSFAPYCTNPQGFLGPYNTTRLNRAITIAQTLGLWIIVDYHGYADIFNTTNVNGVTVQQCWLNFWSGVTSRFKDSYSKLIWEPENEPAYCPNHAGANLDQGCFFNNATAAMPTLDSEYQAFITQTRNQGDSHWIVVQSICSYECNFCTSGNGDCSAAVSGYPTITDPLNRIFISLHAYMSYQVYHNSWSNATADSLALSFYNTMLGGIQSTGFQVLNTEGGPGPTQARINGTLVDCPDLIIGGSSGYCKSNVRFIQTLTSLLETHSPEMINWLWWTAGDWSSSSGAGILGALATGSWGSSITWQRSITHSLFLKSLGNGTIFPAPGNYSFLDGTIVNISATPSASNIVTVWQQGNEQQNGLNLLHLQMNSDQSVVVKFEIRPPPEAPTIWNIILSTISEDEIYIILISSTVLGATATTLIRRRLSSAAKAPQMALLNADRVDDPKRSKMKGKS